MSGSTTSQHGRRRTDSSKSTGWAAYARWHLSDDDEINEGTKGRYKYPYGDFRNVHRCAVLAAESRAGKRKYTDIELAAAHLHGMLEEMTSSQHREWERRHVSYQ